ncbi:FadR family transcriptional regulator [candidate division KSB1 bacterium]|nr:FadR family transcriptional regulator [candidate division KSB1 bacterium]
MSSPFNKIQREESLSHKVERQIREAIRKKVFLPGDKLPGEFELAEKFGVSRTAVREALRMLSGRGLVDIRKGSGVYVTEMDISNVVDPLFNLLDMKCGKASLLHILRVRLFMEPEITRIAVMHSSEKDVEYLEEMYQHMETHKNNPVKNINYDIKFHQRISQATNNPLVPIIMEPIFQLLDKFISSTYKQSHASDLAIKFHHELVECFKTKDADRAFSVMHQHLSHAEEHIIQYYKSIGFTEFDLS